MKKLLSIALVLIMVLCMVACGSSDEGSESADAAYTIGICQLIEHPALDSATEGFMDAIKDEMGDEVSVKLELAQGEYNNCVTIVNNFIASDVDLIMANATGALQAAVAGTADIPILGTSITAYDAALGVEIKDGCVGSNVSGTSDLAPLDAQAQMIADIFPEVKNVGILYCSSEANSAYQVEVMTAELAKLGISANEFAFSDSNDLASVVTAACASSDLLYLPTDNTIASNTGIIDNICVEEGVPCMAGEEGETLACGTVTLALKYYDIGYQTGVMAAQILRDGADISTMPIQYAAQFTKEYEASHCEMYGIEVPDDYTLLE